MGVVGALPKDVAQWLSTQPLLSEITFVTEYPSSKQPSPIKGLIVSVGIDEVFVHDKSQADVEEGSTSENHNEYCRQAEIKIKFLIHAPASLGSEVCHNAFVSIIDCLTFNSELAVMESGCSKIEGDRFANALVMHAWVKINADLCPAQEYGEGFGSYFDRELICSSHINNTEIHTSATEKGNWNVPFITSYYFGTGTATKSFTVGFKPRIVMVFPKDGCPLATSSVNFAIAARTMNTFGLQITDTGFIVGEGASANSQVIHLNETGKFYFFIAFK